MNSIGDSRSDLRAMQSPSPDQRLNKTHDPYNNNTLIRGDKQLGIENGHSAS